MNPKLTPKNARAPKKRAKIHAKTRKVARSTLLDFTSSPPKVLIPEIANPKAADPWFDLLIRVRELTEKDRVLQHYDRKDLLRQGLAEPDPELQLYLLRKAAGASAKDKLYQALLTSLQSALPMFTTMLNRKNKKPCTDFGPSAPVTDEEIEAMLRTMGITPAPTEECDTSPDEAPPASPTPGGPSEFVFTPPFCGPLKKTPKPKAPKKALKPKKAVKPKARKAAPKRRPS